MAGPNLQIPAQAASALDQEKFKIEWYSAFSTMQQLMFNQTRNGPTAERPTSSSPYRYIGMPYYDSTKGFMVWLKSMDPDVWIRYDGTAV